MFQHAKRLIGKQLVRKRTIKHHSGMTAKVGGHASRQFVNEIYIHKSGRRETAPSNDANKWNFSFKDRGNCRTTWCTPKIIVKYVSKPKACLQATHHFSFRHSKCWGSWHEVDRRNVLVPVNPVLSTTRRSAAPVTRIRWESLGRKGGVERWAPIPKIGANTNVFLLQNWMWGTRLASLHRLAPVSKNFPSISFACSRVLHCFSTFFPNPDGTHGRVQISKSRSLCLEGQMQERLLSNKRFVIPPKVQRSIIRSDCERVSRASSTADLIIAFDPTTEVSQLLTC